MKILITGGSGLIGSALVKLLLEEGHTCFVLSRRANLFRKQKTFTRLIWLAYDDPLPEVDAVIHLAGESVAGLWTGKKKEKILKSRVKGVKNLIEILSRRPNPPRIFLGASAVGWYGNRPGETLDENSGPDPEKKFRWQVCQAWENATKEASQWGARVVHLRIGNVLDPAGGYLRALLWPWRLGLGIGLGAKEANLSWIGLSDAVRLIAFTLECEALQGPVNLTAPHPLTQADFTNALKKQLRPLIVLRIPAWILKFFLGEFSQAVTDSQEVLPAKALRAGFVFENRRWPDLSERLFPGRRREKTGLPSRKVEA